MKNNRITYMDTAKAYLILLVILGHVLIVINPWYEKLYLSAAQSFIYTFHMPAFFIINGILFNNEKWKTESGFLFIKQRWNSLIKPYFIFEITGLVCHLILKKQSVLDGVKNLFTVRCNVGADWFLPAMFMGSILFLWYVKHPNRGWRTMLLCICFGLPIIIPNTQIFIVIGRALLACGFILLGNVAKEIFLSERVKSLKRIGISFLLTVIMAMWNLKFGGNDLYSCSVNNLVTLIGGGVSGTLFIVGISQLSSGKMLEKIGRQTLVIMGTHQLIIYIVLALAPGIHNGSVMQGIGLVVGICILEALVLVMDERRKIICQNE